MSVCWNMDTREWMAGVWDQEAGRYRYTSRAYWRDILGPEGVSFVTDLLKRMTDHEVKHGGKPLKLTTEEYQKWSEANAACFAEGWDRFYFDGRGHICCASRIKIERIYSAPDNRYQSLSDADIDGFVAEHGD